MGKDRIESQDGSRYKSPEGTAPEARDTPNRGRRRQSAGVRKSGGTQQLQCLPDIVAVAFAAVSGNHLADKTGEEHLHADNQSHQREIE